MKLSDFYFDLPKELIAQSPLEKRDSSKLLVLHKSDGQSEHRFFNELPKLLKSGDILVRNNSKVFPARLFGKKETGGKVEILLSREVEPGIWEVIGKGLKLGNLVDIENSILKGTVINQDEELYTISFNLKSADFFKEIEKAGFTPLPPYIKSNLRESEERKRYQTVYAKDIGSSAAPTAGLHFTEKLFDDLKTQGVTVLDITLHVGLGTFQPIKSDRIEEHKIHQEFFTVKKEALDQIKKAKKEARRVISVGTTTARVLESVFRGFGLDDGKTISGFTDIFIYPGYEFKCVDGLITNFHLPASTLLMLVSAFAGRECIMKAYKEAVKNNYRFFSYGDAMFITRKAKTSGYARG